MTLPSSSLSLLSSTPNLTHLDLADCAQIDDAGSISSSPYGSSSPSSFPSPRLSPGLALIAANCKRLVTLDVSGLRRITETGLIPLLQNNA